MSCFKDLNMKRKMVAAAAAMMVPVLAACPMGAMAADTTAPAAQEEQQTTPEQSSVTIGIGSDESSVSFTWFYNENENEASVKVAKKADLVDGKMPENAKVYKAEIAKAVYKAGYYTNKVTVDGLEANTEYAYQLVNDDTQSEVKTFTASKIKSDKSFSFAFAGDPQIGASGNAESDTKAWEKTLDLLKNNDKLNDISFLQSAGDQVNYYWGRESEYDGYLNHDVIQSLPMGVSVGNHDASSLGYGDHFNMPNESRLGQTNTYEEGYRGNDIQWYYGVDNSKKTGKDGGDFYYTYGNTLFMDIDSNSKSMAEHAQFIKQAIKATADKDIRWKVVMFHHSIYSVANHADEEDILQRRAGYAPIFKENGIDAVLQGHDHVYVRSYLMDGETPLKDDTYYDTADKTSATNAKGILYVTANSASGSKYYTIQNKDFDYAAVKNQERVPNITKVSVTDNSFKVTTYRTSDMSLVDEFTLNKAKNTPETNAAAIAKLQQELNDTKKELDDTKKQLADAKADTEQQLADAKADTEKNTARLDALQDKADKTEEALKKTQADLQKAQDQNNTDADTIAKLQKSVDDLKKKVDNVAKQTDNATSTQPTKAPAATEATVAGVQYKLVGTDAQAVKAVDKKAKKANVKASVQIGDKKVKVTSIAPKAFKSNKNLKTVVIGQNVETIGKNAFAGDKKLQKVTIKSKVLKTVEKNAFKKAGNKKTVAKVTTKAKKKAYKKLLKKAGFKGIVK